MNKLIKPFAIIMALTVPAVASADVEMNQVNENEVLITYNTDEASTSQGRAELVHQIRRAARKVCGPLDLNRAGSMRVLAQNQNCYKKAVMDALSSTSVVS